MSVSRSETKPDLTFVEKRWSSRGNRGMKGGTEEEKRLTVGGSSSPQRRIHLSLPSTPGRGGGFVGNYMKIKTVSSSTEGDCFTLMFSETKTGFHLSGLTVLKEEFWDRRV